MSVRIASPPFWGPLWCLGPPRTIAGHLGLANPPSGTPRASTDFNSKSIGILEAFIKIYRDLKISFRFPARGGFTNPRSSVSRTKTYFHTIFVLSNFFHETGHRAADPDDILGIQRWNLGLHVGGGWAPREAFGNLKTFYVGVRGSPERRIISWVHGERESVTVSCRSVVFVFCFELPPPPLPARGTQKHKL